jgi:hypothetical protein
MVMDILQVGTVAKVFPSLLSSLNLKFHGEVRFIRRCRITALATTVAPADKCAQGLPLSSKCAAAGWKPFSPLHPLSPHPIPFLPRSSLLFHLIPSEEYRRAIWMH